MLSLLWGIENFGTRFLLAGREEQALEEEQTLIDWLLVQITAVWETGSHTAVVGEVAKEIQTILDQRLMRNKDRLVKKILKKPYNACCRCIKN